MAPAKKTIINVINFFCLLPLASTVLWGLGGALLYYIGYLVPLFEEARRQLIIPIFLAIGLVVGYLVGIRYYLYVSRITNRRRGQRDVNKITS